MLKDQALCARLPHAGTMCLLHELLDWDQVGLVCTALSHREPNNPLRRNGRLAAIHAIEYAGQAVALHAVLAGAGAGMVAGRSLLAAVNAVELSREDLEQLGAPLHITANRELALGSSLIYQFRITCGALSVAQGRLTVVGGLRPQP